MGFLNYDFFQMTKNLHSRYSCTTAKGMIIMNIPSLRHTILFGRNELTCNTKDDCVMHHAVVLPNSLTVICFLALAQAKIQGKFRESLLEWKNGPISSDQGFLQPLPQSAASCLQQAIDFLRKGEEDKKILHVS